MIWVELPENIDIVPVCCALREANIHIAVGSLLSASGKYRNCLRLNYALPVDAKIEAALRKTGEALSQVLENA